MLYKMIIEQTHLAMPHKFFFKSRFAFSMSLRILLILCCCEKSVIGTLTLSPMTVAPVCRVGDPLTITCTASVVFIRWSVLQVNEQGTLERVTSDVNSNSRDVSQQMTQRTVNSAMFTFMRSSTQNATPHITTLSIDSVNTGLNGTVVQCMDVDNPMTSASTTIQIIDISQNQYVLTLAITSEEYEADNVTVTVEWAQQVGAVYTIRVLLPVPIMVTGSARHQLTIPYNIVYNFSVEAVAPCRASATAAIRLHYANCGYPEVLSTVGNDSTSRVEGYGGLPIEGTNITFSCPPGMLLIGPNSAICTGNGQWEPDPTRLMCIDSKVTLTCEHPFLNTPVGSFLKALNYSEPAVVGTTILFNCSEPRQVLVGPNTTTCMSDGQWAPDPSRLLMNCKVSCGAPDLKINVYYLSYNSTVEGSTVTFLCTNMLSSAKVFTTMCHKNASWYPDPVNKCTATLRSFETSCENGKIAVVSSVTVLVVTSIVFFIVGFLCRHFCWKERKMAETLPPSVETQAPYYEDVVIKQEEQELELKENVAYAPIR